LKRLVYHCECDDLHDAIYVDPPHVRVRRPYVFCMKLGGTLQPARWEEREIYRDPIQGTRMPG
jgi:hypothetical protein